MTDYRRKRATVRLRRGDWQVKPEAEQLDGRSFWFRHAWHIDADDPGVCALYLGETAYMPDDPEYPRDAPLWVSSGDLDFGTAN